jgi:hypothetical protein
LWTGIVDKAKGAFDNLVTLVKNIGPNLIAAFKSLGSKILSVFTSPFKVALSLIRNLVSAAAGTDVGKKALSRSGIGIKELNTSLGKIPGVNPVQTSGFTEDSNAISGQTVKKQAIARPPSAEQTGRATAAAMRGSTGSPQGGGSNVRVNVSVSGKLIGRDLNLAVTRSQIHTSKLRGKTIDPLVESRNITNGQQFIGG